MMKRLYFDREFRQTRIHTVLDLFCEIMLLKYRVKFCLIRVLKNCSYMLTTVEICLFVLCVVMLNILTEL